MAKFKKPNLKSTYNPYGTTWRGYRLRKSEKNIGAMLLRHKTTNKKRTKWFGEAKIEKYALPKLKQKLIAHGKLANWYHKLAAAHKAVIGKKQLNGNERSLHMRTIKNYLRHGKKHDKEWQKTHELIQAHPMNEIKLPRFATILREAHSAAQLKNKAKEHNKASADATVAAIRAIFHGANHRKLARKAEQHLKASGVAHELRSKKEQKRFDKLRQKIWGEGLEEARGHPKVAALRQRQREEYMRYQNGILANAGGATEHGLRRLLDTHKKERADLKAQISKNIHEARRGRPRKIALPSGTDIHDEPNNHIIMQLRKAVSLRGAKPVLFKSGETKPVSAEHAQRALDLHYHARRPDQKEDLIRKLHHSHKSFKDTIGV